MTDPLLTADIILRAYRHGYFPMALGPTGEIGFYYFEPRGIIPLDERFIVRRSLRAVLRKKEFRVTYDSAFEEVMRRCSRHDELPESEIWISEELIARYKELYTRGIAHSVEVWKEGILAGGLYGLEFGSAFCGESMFSEEPYASQVALVALVERLRSAGFTLLDAQMESEHLKQFGLYTATQEEYMQMFEEASAHPCLGWAGGSAFIYERSSSW